MPIDDWERDLLISDKERMRRKRLPYGRHGSGKMLQDTPSLHIFVMMDAYFLMLANHHLPSIVMPDEHR
jgi:hypothetical protein